MQSWELIYEQYGHMALAPQKDMPGIVELFKQRGVRKVLDLGCGSGRHLVFLAERGFEMFGLDLSQRAIELAADWLKERGLMAKLELGSVFERLPYENDFFDAIISTRVLNHGKIEDIRNAIVEMQRTLKPKRLIFVEVRKDRKIRPSRKQSSRSRLICDRTHIPLQGKEKGVVHYQFNKAILMREFKNFTMLDFWVDSGAYYLLVGELKRGL